MAALPHCQVGEAIVIDFAGAGIRVQCDGVILDFPNNVSSYRFAIIINIMNIIEG